MTELSLAVPHVVTQRLLRMAAAGTSPSAHDRREFMLMGTEKALAFYQSWAAMWLQAWRLQVSMLQGLTSASIMPFAAAPRTLDFAKAASAGARVLSAGLAPVHGKAVANAKRLSRRRR